MNNVNKIEIELTFPNGAHFYNNIHMIVYKQLMKFIHQLNCISPVTKCNECQLSSNCRYYHCTGENFKYYPCIIIHNDTFTKSIYKKQENIVFKFYTIGNGKLYIDYIIMFFQSYLNQILAQNMFYIKDIRQEVLDNRYIFIRNMRIYFVVENIQFMEVYNHMIQYYNDKYDCDFQLIKGQYCIDNNKHVSLEPLFLKTKKIIPKGYIYQIHFDTEIQILQFLKETGIGKYNFIGGGYFEN